MEAKDKKILTEEDIRNAVSYLPLAKKTAMARAYAQDCLLQFDISTGNEEVDKVFPSRFQENPQKRMLYGMLVLLREYLKKMEDEDLSTEQYDVWGASSIFNQLDRFKSSKDPEIRNKVYDLVDDYREFYRMLGTEINSLAEAKNDLLARFVQYVSLSQSPEALQEQLEQLEKLTQEIEGMKGTIKEADKKEEK
jgi:hypothetical protein